MRAQKGLCYSLKCLNFLWIPCDLTTATLLQLFIQFSVHFMKHDSEKKSRWELSEYSFSVEKILKHIQLLYFA